MKKIIVVAIVFILSCISGCADIPDQADLNEVIDDILTEIEQEKQDKCGNGTVEEWEECDFFGFNSCNKYDETLIGPISCNNCIQNMESCEELATCREKHCSGNGTCKERYLYKDVYCICDDGYTGDDCSEEENDADANTEENDTDE